MQKRRRLASGWCSPCGLSPQAVTGLDIDALSPRDALDVLYALKKAAGEG